MFVISCEVQGPYAIGITGSEDGTTVRIYLGGQTAISFSHGTRTYINGDTCIVTLNKYETLQVQS